MLASSYGGAVQPIIKFKSINALSMEKTIGYFVSVEEAVMDAIRTDTLLESCMSNFGYREAYSMGNEEDDYSYRSKPDRREENP